MHRSGLEDDGDDGPLAGLHDSVARPIRRFTSEVRNRHKDATEASSSLSEPNVSAPLLHFQSLLAPAIVQMLTRVEAVTARAKKVVAMFGEPSTKPGSSEECVALAHRTDGANTG